VSVGPHAQEHEIEPQGLAEDGPDLLFRLRRAVLGHRVDRVDVLRRNGNVREQGLPGRAVVAVRVTLGHAALVAEEDVRLGPGNISLGEQAVRREGRRAPRERHQEPAVPRDGLGRRGDEHVGQPGRDLRGRRQHLEDRRVVRGGVHHGRRQRRPSRAMSATAASGPHVPAS
jgi:hypothetical protein